MIWLIEEGFYSRHNFVKLTDALEETKTHYNIVNVTENSVDCYIKDGEKYMICGGNKFSRLAEKENLIPGTYKNDNFDHSVCVENWGKHMLNYDYVIGDLFTIEPKWDEFFIRPLMDDKLMVGKVMNREELELKKKHSEGSFKDKMLIAAPVKEIIVEYRFFIVNSRIITSSVYMVGGKLLLSKLVPIRIRDYVSNVISKWEPSKAYVLDIAETRNGLGVIEINNINASGFYDTDVTLLVKALNELNK